MWTLARTSSSWSMRRCRRTRAGPVGDAGARQYFVAPVKVLNSRATASTSATNGGIGRRGRLTPIVSGVIRRRAVAPSQHSGCPVGCRAAPAVVLRHGGVAVERAARSPQLTYSGGIRRRWVAGGRTSATLAAAEGGDASTATMRSVLRRIWSELIRRPLQYLAIPSVAAFVGLTTNWMGVKMLFYPIEYTGLSWYRSSPEVPYGFLGWQGVVPCKTEKMANRLVNVVTDPITGLLTAGEAFGRMDPATLAELLLPIVEEELLKDFLEGWNLVDNSGGRGGWWRRWWPGATAEECCAGAVRSLRPLTTRVLTKIATNLQKEIDGILDLRSVVLEAFVRDKRVLVELFQKVGRVELDFLVESGLGFGFLLGLLQMCAWAVRPKPWTLPVAGALVGYATNWIAIKLLFDPAEPVEVSLGVGSIVVQGLFESRQPEVSEEFGQFMAGRVLTSPALLASLARKSGECDCRNSDRGDGGIVCDDTDQSRGEADEKKSADGSEEGELHAFLRRELPRVVPHSVVSAAVRAIANAAEHPKRHPELHEYMTQCMDIEQTLSSRLKLLSPTDFEDLLHPVFQEDEEILIAVGGVLGAMAGLAQTRMGWGGPRATFNAIATLIGVSASSLGYFALKEYVEPKEEVHVEEEIAVRPVVNLRRRNSLVRIRPDPRVLPKEVLEFWDAYQ